MEGTGSSSQKVSSKEQTPSDVTRGPFNKLERRAQNLKERDPKPEDRSPSDRNRISTNSIPLECLRVTYKRLPLAE